MYVLRNASETQQSCVIRVADSAFIPMNEANTDYQAYLEWVAAGNTPEVIEG